MLQIRGPSIFAKRNTALEIPTHELSEEPSKRTIATSIFPDPRQIRPTFDFSNLEALFPSSWRDQFERTEEGEILLTQDQVTILRDLLIESRTKQLVEVYTKRLQNFVEQYEQAGRVAVTLPPESATLWG
jgi:hypothetical protein